MELVKLLLIRLRLILQYRILLVLTIIHIIILAIANQGYSSIENFDSKSYIKQVKVKEETYTYTTKDAIIYSSVKLSVGDYISYKDACIDNTQRNYIDFDYSKFLNSNNIKCSLYEPIIEKYQKQSKFYIIKNSIREIFASNDIKGLKSAIIFGDKSLLEEKDKQVFYNMHLAHLLALSGMHIALVTLFIRYIVSKVVETKENIDIFVLILITIYCYLIDYSYSVIRAFMIMYLVLFLNKLKINLSKLTVFLIVLNLVLFSNRFSIYSYSLIYSFLCYFILILVMDQSYLKIYVFITLFTIPITINLSNQINIIGILIAPLLSILFEIIYFPYLLITTILKIPDVFSEIFLNLLHFLYSDNFTIIIKDIEYEFIILYYAMLYYIIYLGKRIDIVKILLCFCIVLLNVYVRKPTITLMFFDVGQGDSMLMSLDNGVNILIDGGGSGYDEKKSEAIAKYTLIPYLKDQGIRSIDYVIATHGDSDHMGSFEYLLKNYKYDNMFINCNEETESEKKLGGKQLNYLKLESINYNIEFSCSNNDNENDSSIVTLARLFDIYFLSMGDLSYKYEDEILNDIDILKVSHHGSNTSTSLNLVDNITPKYAIISVGKNSYGHPTKEVLSALNNSNVYRTDVSGAIKVSISDEVIITTRIGE